MSSRINAIIVIISLSIALFSSSIFYVDQRERVLLLRLGQIERANYTPGIHFKIPLLNEIKRFDGRTLTLDVKPEEYLTGEKKKLLVDSFILWRVADVSIYYTALGGNTGRAGLRLFNIVNNALRNAFAKRTVQDVVAGDRREMVENIRNSTNNAIKNFGIEVVNIRIKRIDFPSEINNRVFARMKSEREREAKELRAEGAEEAEKIRSSADRQRIIILADADRQAQELRGNGDALATETYAHAYGQNKKFYSLYRRLTAYQNVFTNEDILVIEPKGDFFNRFSKSKD
ncbi:MAG: protease modulator HflC [Piscirickettsiaceae bacterium]|nr:protease modulator HflC [Piscirickettsiaceae bacterium]